MMDIDQMCAEISASPKYAGLYPPLIRRICAEEHAKYKRDRERLKAAKNRLHMSYGEFTREGGADRRRELLDALRDGRLPLRDFSAQAMELHASTRERMGQLREFYAFIFGVTGSVSSILDIGCGFHPFSIPLMPPDVQDSLKSYRAYDIDLGLVDLLNVFFDMTGLPASAKPLDIITETPPGLTDMALLLKLLPVIESQAKGRGAELINALDTRFIIVTYPVRTLSGRQKGMERHYMSEFERLMEKVPGADIADKRVIGGELVIVLKKAGRKV